MSKFVLVLMLLVGLMVFVLIVQIGLYIATVSSVAPYWLGVISGCIALPSAAMVFSSMNKGRATIYGLGVKKEDKK